MTQPREPAPDAFEPYPNSKFRMTDEVLEAYVKGGHGT